MKQNPRGNDEIESFVVEREFLDVAQQRVDAPRSRQFHHPRRNIDGDDVGAQFAGDALRELTRPGPHFEHLPRVSRRDMTPDDLASVRPITARIEQSAIE